MPSRILSASTLASTTRKFLPPPAHIVPARGGIPTFVLVWPVRRFVACTHGAISLIYNVSILVRTMYLGTATSSLFLAP
jgi:hypothetical protein